jgi:hypothetical protein
MKQIELTENVMVSDPCYEKGTWCQEEIVVKPGVYCVMTQKKDGRVDKLLAMHIDHTDAKLKKKPYCTIGVDSGQAGIFSLDTFRNDKVFEGEESDFAKRMGLDEGDGEKWYSHICDLTLGEDSWGTYANGVASSSGWGDGSYDVFVAEAKSGEIVGILIDFEVGDY